MAVHKYIDGYVVQVFSNTGVFQSQEFVSMDDAYYENSGGYPITYEENHFWAPSLMAQPNTKKRSGDEY